MDRDADGLTQAQGLALIFEMDSARQLLAAGESTLRSARYIDPVFDAVLTTTSIGVEKVLKLALGLSSLSGSGAWPSKAVMRDDFGHGSVQMYALLRSQIEEWLAERSRPSYPHELVDRVDHDQVWPRLLELLDGYGRSGRFYYLDKLAEDAQRWESPAGLWDATEAAALAQHPHLTQAFGGSTVDLDALPLAIRNAIADSLVGWWTMIAGVARHGAFGDRGKKFGFEAHPDAALRPGRA